MAKPTDIESFLTADGTTLPERLDHWVTHRPDAICIYDGETDEEFTYAQFGAITDTIAGNLARHGIAKGDRVSVFTTNSLLATKLLFACWKAGAIYSPVNFSYQGRLLSYQLRDTSPQLIFTDAQLIDKVREVAEDIADDVDAAVVVFAEDRNSTNGIAQLPWSDFTTDAHRPEVTIAPFDPANIVYTSGTTGPAKGVLQTHLWVNQYTFGLRACMTVDDVVYNDLPMYHVGGAFANVGRAIWMGCEAAIWNRFSPSEFWGRIARRGATCAILLDAMIPWLMNAPELDSDRANTLNKVHMQPLPMQHTDVARRFGIDWVSAGFGQTESGGPLSIYMHECGDETGTPKHLRKGMSDEEIAQTCRRYGIFITDGDQITRKGVMGYPVEFADVAILDEDDTECAPGVAGELAVRPKIEHIMMIEYIGKPEATAQAWRGGWFHTGDAAIKDADGSFRFVDRLGDRIRVRGENLSSFQVEDLLNGHPNVQMSAVFAIPSREGDEDDIIASVVPAEGANLTEDELRTFAEESMPKFMRPKYFRIVEALPRTPTNKVEKYKLRAEFEKHAKDRL